MRAGARLFAAAFALALSLTANAHAAPADGMDAAFGRACAEFDVPRDLAVAVGYGETHLDGHAGEPSQANGFGVMHLVSNPTRRTLEQAAELTGESTASLRADDRANIRGGVAVLRALADAHGLGDRTRLAAWYPVVAAYSGASDPGVASSYADTVFELLRTGLDARTPAGERVSVPPRQVSRPSTPDIGVLSADYGPARWAPAHGNNYAAGRSARIDKIVIHVTQGSYAGSISWFQNPTSKVSAHYVIRSSDGEVTQTVREGDTAYHARSWNPRSVGIEHEGFVNNPSWFTDAMYRSSAALTRHLADRYGIAKTRANIVGHNEVPGNDHTDPGPHWNWAHYMQLVNGGGAANVFTGSSADFNGDGRDDIVAFTQNSLGDVYVSLSTGTGFGPSGKWHEFFAPAGETPLTGDFNGDGKDDIITFTHGSRADAMVSLSTGTGFGQARVWHDFFALGGEVPAIGDVNGDGKDDIVVFTRNQLGDVYVALSNGSGFGPSAKWHDYFGIAGESPGVADVNGDGKDDIVVFTQDTRADVLVAFSSGAGFGAPALWHEFFAVGREAPRLGDFNGDGAADIATFTNDANGDVYVANSNKTNAFTGTSVKWQDFFGIAGEFPYVGDFNGDGKTDVVTFTHTASADVYVALSTGTGFLGGAKWHDFFGLPGERAL
ncbi:hypothetical protein JOF53_001361 [Crossiella equi]|uniref:N-acetylmuramoyl-L-alanine amidase n=1 Tax=Crossiella equi TaxID=130796 RepID=A0ABS5A7A9_9PSEU|nr:N-acetylmuramoyl-L-alanine amidase [Crossiella equi]MBP2472489.1 hypothetical protein [Crossiella equi]